MRQSDSRGPAIRFVADAEREVAQPADLDLTHAEAEAVLHAIATHRPTAQPDEPSAPAATTRLRGPR